MQEFGLLDVYVDWGGDIRSMGAKPGEGPAAAHTPWTAGVLRPPTTVPAAALPSSSCDDYVELPPAGASLCTSGDYYQWSHLIDAVMPAPDASMMRRLHWP